MAKFILSYRASKAYNPTADPGGAAAWGSYLGDVIRPQVLDPGWPVFEPTTAIGVTDSTTQLGGYSVIDAKDLEAALAIARQCPAIEQGGGVEVGALADLPPEHPAEDMRAALPRA